MDVLDERYKSGEDVEVDMNALELTEDELAAWAKLAPRVDYVIGITASLARPSVGAMHLIQTVQSIISV